MFKAEDFNAWLHGHEISESANYLLEKRIDQYLLDHGGTVVRKDENMHGWYAKEHTEYTHAGILWGVKPIEFKCKHEYAASCYPNLITCQYKSKFCPDCGEKL